MVSHGHKCESSQNQLDRGDNTVLDQQTKDLMANKPPLYQEVLAEASGKLREQIVRGSPDRLYTLAMNLSSTTNICFRCPHCQTLLCKSKTSRTQNTCTTCLHWNTSPKAARVGQEAWNCTTCQAFICPACANDHARDPGKRASTAGAPNAGIGSCHQPAHSQT